MVRPLMTDTVFLAQKALPADAGDIAVADDLLDTLKAHEDGCVGMAANMIGVNKAIIVFDNDGGHCMSFLDLKGKRRLILHQPNISPNERMKLFYM